MYALKKNRVYFIGIAIFMLIFLASCSFVASIGNDDPTVTPSPSPTAIPTPTPTLEPEPTPEPEPTGTTSLTIRAVGDIMMHSPQITAGLAQDGNYNFDHFFTDIKPYLEGADIVMGNLETTISNEEVGYGGYPMFRCPEQLLQSLKYAGFNVITTANNHSFDGREFGVTNTLDKLDEYGLMHTGTARSQEERDQVLIIEENDIKVAILAYTYGTNGMEVTIPDEKIPYMINSIDKEKIATDIENAKQAGAEVLVVSIHMGDEYVRSPNEFQKETVDYLASLGVDIILGSHPHVLQPLELKEVTLDDNTKKDVFIIYSLGNFISNQRDRYRDSGVILDIEIVKDYDNKKIDFGEIAYTPTWVYRYSENGKSDYRVLPVKESIAENLSQSATERIGQVWNETTTLLGQEFANIKQ